MVIEESSYPPSLAFGFANTLRDKDVIKRLSRDLCHKEMDTFASILLIYLTNEIDSLKSRL